MDNANNTALSLYEAAEYLGISAATMRNWIKLGKATPLGINPPVFSGEYIEDLHRRLDTSTMLKTRRNKSRVSDGFIPRTYIDSASPNYPLIIDLLNALSKRDISPLHILSFYAKELLQKAGVDNESVERLISQPGLNEDGSQMECDGTGLYEDGCKMGGDAHALSELLLSHPLIFVPGEDTLGMLYISLKLIRQKKSQGAYYTPFFVVDSLLENICELYSPDNKQILDPACGTGNFLLRLPADIPLCNIHGTDIDETAVAIARINLSMKYKAAARSCLDTIFQNVRCENFLMPGKPDPPDEKSGSKKPLFDIILGNPPWGYSFAPNEAVMLGYMFSSSSGSRNPESFALFVEQSLRNMRPNAVMSLLLPETILGADIHAPIRQYILEQAYVVSISYLGEVFDKVQCPSIILTLKKKPSTQEISGIPATVCSKVYTVSDNLPVIKVSFKEPVKGSLITRKSFTASNDRLSITSFHLLSDNAEYRILEKMRFSPHFTLEGKATFCLGIVTGSNKTLLKSEPGQGLEPILKGKDIVRFGIKAPGSYISFAPEKFQQCAPTKLYRHGEKLFYRFIADEPVFALDRQSLLSLNSANIMIPKVPDYSALYILAVLNSSAMSFYYKKSFKGMKVLRSAIESLPIPCCEESVREEISRLADALSFSELSERKKPRDFDHLKELLDKKIASLYGLTDHEYELTIKE